jgi:hypothetical protein
MPLRFASSFTRAGLAVFVITTLSCGGTEPAAPVPVASVTVSPSSSSLIVGGTQQLTATTLDASNATLTGRAITWASSDATKASVTSTGLVSAVAIGSATITATSEGKSGTSAVTITPVPVAAVTVAPSAPTVFVGSIQQLTATTLDATGAALTGRTITWTTSDATRATVSSTGLVKAVAVGTATITATSEGKSGTVAATLIATPANIILTGIHDASTFVSRCPTNDPAYTTIRQDFELRSDGPLSTVSITCTEPYTTTPIDQLTDELLAMQTFRMVYYLSQGTAGKLPWTTLSFYDWMKSEIAGVNFHAEAGLSACCEIINGKKYMIISRKAASSRDFYRDWDFVSGWMALFAHEARHASGPGHVNGCPAFPLPTDPVGCDATYDLSNLGSYGVQYWLFAGLATGSINVGIGCAPAATAESLASSAARSANLYLTQFVTNAPPSVTATTPYGGPCYPP